MCLSECFPPLPRGSCSHALLWTNLYVAQPLLKYKTSPCKNPCKDTNTHIPQIQYYAPTDSTTHRPRTYLVHNDRLCPTTPIVSYRLTNNTVLPTAPWSTISTDLRTSTPSARRAALLLALNETADGYAKSIVAKFDQSAYAAPTEPGSGYDATSVNKFWMYETISCFLLLWAHGVNNTWSYAIRAVSPSPILPSTAPHVTVTAFAVALFTWTGQALDDLIASVSDHAAVSVGGRGGCLGGDSGVAESV